MMRRSRDIGKLEVGNLEETLDGAGLAEAVPYLLVGVNVYHSRLSEFVEILGFEHHGDTYLQYGCYLLLPT